MADSRPFAAILISRVFLATLAVVPPLSARAGCTDGQVSELFRQKNELSDQWRAETLDRLRQAQDSFQLSNLSSRLANRLSEVKNSIAECAAQGNRRAMLSHAYALVADGDAIAELVEGNGTSQEVDAGISSVSEHAQQFYAQAHDLFQTLAAQGDPGAMRTLGWQYERGHGVAASRSLALEWISRAGLRFLQIGDRGYAAHCPDDLRRIGPEHPLTLDLMKRVQAALIR